MCTYHPPNLGHWIYTSTISALPAPFVSFPKNSFRELLLWCPLSSQNQFNIRALPSSSNGSSKKSFSPSLSARLSQEKGKKKNFEHLHRMKRLHLKSTITVTRLTQTRLHVCLARSWIDLNTSMSRMTSNHLAILYSLQKKLALMMLHVRIGGCVHLWCTCTYM